MTINHDSRCVWMQAGILSYKLCDREFDCENCEFDRAIRGILPPKSHGAFDRPQSSMAAQGTTAYADPLVNKYLYHFLSDCKIHLDRCYHPSHFWYKPDGADNIFVGINNLLLKLLRPVQKIIPPTVGQAYSRGQLMAWIVRKDKPIPLYSPITGHVISINENLPAGPLQGDEYIFRMSGENLQSRIQKLCGEMSGLHFFREKITQLQHTLGRHLSNQLNAEIGATMADGGQLEVNFEKVIGEKAFHAFITKFVSGHSVTIG